MKVLNEEQLKNAYLPIDWILHGIINDSNSLHNMNAFMQIEINDEFDGIINDFSREQSEKANSAMNLT